jgi:diguanylate cyclase (GGDEF)-like protein
MVRGPARPARIDVVISCSESWYFAPREERMSPSHWSCTTWRRVAGPLLTLAMAGAFMLLARYGIRIPVPGAFMIGMIFLSAYVGGGVAGYVSAIIGIGCCLALVSDPDLSFLPDRQFRLPLIVVLGLILPFLINHLQNRAARRLESERALRERAESANRELLLLRSELVRHTQELERLATTDDLTGLWNRRHFLALAEDERRRHKDEQRPLALLIFDIDLFKLVNDQFGHDAGDAVIRHVADICRDELGRSGILARLGGEEFVLLLPETSGGQAVARAEEIRRRLQATPFEVDGADVTVTVSIGVSEADAETESIGALMKRADQALYQAKRDGRNCVRHASGAPSTVGDEAAAAGAIAA